MQIRSHLQSILEVMQCLDINYLEKYMQIRGHFWSILIILTVVIVGEGMKNISAIGNIDN